MNYEWGITNYIMYHINKIIVSRLNATGLIPLLRGEQGECFSIFTH